MQLNGKEISHWLRLLEAWYGSIDQITMDEHHANLYFMVQIQYIVTNMHIHNYHYYVVCIVGLGRF